MDMRMMEHVEHVDEGASLHLGQSNLRRSPHALIAEMWSNGQMEWVQIQYRRPPNEAEHGRSVSCLEGHFRSVIGHAARP